MKHLIKTVLCTSLALWLISCNQAWVDHYETRDEALLEKKLMELIYEDPDLSLFAAMLEKSGYDKVLSASQVYTVWAPNNTALAAVDTSDLNEVNKIVRNHIARFSYPSSGDLNEAVSMLNKKNIHFRRDGQDFLFGNRKVLDDDQAVGNGVLHIIDGIVTFYPNVWEYLGSTNNVDSLRNFMYSFEEYFFDEENSLKIGENEYGQTIYDSIIIYSNPIFEALGELNNEDSLYTVLFPDNQAWIDAYNSISVYYKYAGSISSDNEVKIKADSLQRLISNVYIINDLIFRGDLTKDDIIASDNLISTGGNVFQNPALLFAGASDSTLSNGRAFITNQLNFTPDVWCKPIVVEAENVRGRFYERSQLYYRDTYRSWMDSAISESAYVEVTPSSTSAKPIVTFDIPNTLSTAYNIYCVFVPANVNNQRMDTSKLLPTKMRFTLTYVNAVGRQTSRTYSRPALFVTNPREMTKMLITQTSAGVPEPFNFSFCNFEEDITTVRLTITSTVENSEIEANEFTRDMLIDCIILEPVY